MKGALYTLAITLVSFAIESVEVPAEELYSFSDDGSECIVHKDLLRRPWLNRLRNDELVVWITHNGYIEVFLDDPVFHGLVNPQTVSGHFYIRDNDSEEFLLMNESDGQGDWQSTIGMGYNRIDRTGLGLKSSIVYFVPNDTNVLVARVTIVNSEERRRSLSVFGQVEWNLGDSVKASTRRSDGFGGSQQNWYKHVQCEGDVMFAETRNWKSTHECIPWPYIGYFTMSEPIVSFDTYSTDFHGVKDNWERPHAVENGRCSNATFGGYDEFPYGVLQGNLTLEPGEQREITFLLGMEKEKDKIREVRNKYSNPQQIEKSLSQVVDSYSDFVRDTLTIKTPDSANDRIINIWSKYQWLQSLKKPPMSEHHVLGFWSYGSEGSGTGRQIHPEGLLQGLSPDIARRSLIKTVLEPQVRRCGPPETRPLPENDFLGLHRHQITHFTSSVLFYLLESADTSLLNQNVRFADGSEATVWEHIRCGLDYFCSVINERGLAKVPVGVGDWLDELTQISNSGDAESVMEAAEIAFTLKEFALIAEKTGRNEDRDRWLAVYKRIEKGINEYAWDGEWYSRAFSDRVTPPQVIGSKQNDEGKIYLNAQSWAILSGVSPTDRTNKALDAVEKYLVNEYGAMIFWPPYSEYLNYIGTQTVYSPGFRNGNIYFRPAAWAVMAAAKANRPELANKIYQTSCLAARSRNIDNFKLEPFAYPENYIGPDHRLKGEGQSHWCLGEGSAWMWYAYVNYILGVRAEWDGLLIDPQIPSEWHEYHVRRPFRGSVYDISVHNPNNVSSGVDWIEVDGKRIDGFLIPHTHQPAIRQVNVMMR